MSNSLDCRYDRPVEYEFTLSDGSKRYEIVFDRKDMFDFMKLHKAVSGKPVGGTLRGSA